MRILRICGFVALSLLWWTAGVISGCGQVQECLLDSDCVAERPSCRQGRCQEALPKSCLAGQMLCEGLCIDPESDKAHCGGCGAACGPEERCVMAGCFPEVDCVPELCDGVDNDCDGHIDESAPDRTCMLPCGIQSTQKCLMGGAWDVCKPVPGRPEACNSIDDDCDGNTDEGEVCPCDPGDLRCDGLCVNISSSSQHCGGCEIQCDVARSERCVKGTCQQAACESGKSRCDRDCVDLQTDDRHCGACGRVCDTAQGASCVQGTCQVLSCPVGYKRCGADCVELAVDTRHCGACNNACAVRAGETCQQGQCVLNPCKRYERFCGGRCVDVYEDSSHCGGCGRACLGGRVCVAGKCVVATRCPVGTVSCQIGCRDLLNNPKHCSACGSACSGGRLCLGGNCIPRCPEGRLECDGRCIQPLTDNLHCGACGQVCAADQRCKAGICEDLCVPAAEVCDGKDNDCDGKVDESVPDRKCTLPCGIESFQMCQAGTWDACLPAPGLPETCNSVDDDCDGKTDENCTCPSGETSCQNKCVNLQSSLAHCGACGRACSAGAQCTQGTCN